MVAGFVMSIEPYVADRHRILRGDREAKRSTTMPRLITEYVAGEPYEYYALGRYVVRAKGVCGGKPTFKYTRIEVAGALWRINAGEGIDSIVDGHCGRVPREAISEAIHLADKFGGNLNRRLSHKKFLKVLAA